jgi:hypothetical protein
MSKEYKAIGCRRCNSKMSGIFNVNTHLDQMGVVGNDNDVKTKIMVAGFKYIEKEQVD